MQSTGVVNRINGLEAVVLIKRESACGDNCAGCGGCSAGALREVLAENSLGADIGDVVIIEMNTGKVINAAIFVYIVPLLLLFLGYFIFFNLFKTELTAIFGGFLLMVLAFVFLFKLDKKFKKNYVHKIIEIKKSI